MAMSIDRHNIGKIVEDSLLRELKPVVEDRITKNILKELEKDIRKIVKREVEKVVIEGVENIKDIIKLKEELSVYIEWIEKE